MTRAEALATLRAHEPVLRQFGIDQLALFGSTARDEARIDSDLDLAVKFRPGLKFDWGWYWIQDEIASLLGVSVDLVSEPSSRAQLQGEIDRDRVHVF